jgi:hypothetical protein
MDLRPLRDEVLKLRQFCGCDVRQSRAQSQVRRRSREMASIAVRAMHALRLFR